MVFRTSSAESLFPVRHLWIILLLQLLGWLFFSPANALEDPSPAPQGRQLTVAIKADLNPLEFTDQDGHPLGFTPTLLNELADEDGSVINFRVLKHDEIPQAVASGNVDLAAVILTPELRDRFISSRPLTTIEYAIYVNTESNRPVDINHLDGLTLASLHCCYNVMKLSGSPNFTPRWVHDLTEGFNLLESRKIDGFYAPVLPAEIHLEMHHQHQFKQLQRGLFPADYALIARPENQPLIDQLNRSLARFVDSGKMEILRQRWLVESLQEEPWMQRHRHAITTVLVLLLLSSSLLLWWIFTLLRKQRHDSYLLEQSLDVSNELLKDIDQQRLQANTYLEVSQALIVGLDRQGRIKLANQRACDLLGWEHDELIGLDWFNTFLPEQQQEQIRSIFSRLIANEPDPTLKTDGEVITRSGEVRYIQWHNALQRDEQGQVTGTISSGIDITQRSKALQELSESREKYKSLTTQFESLLHGISEPLVIISRQRRILWANEAAKNDWFLGPSVAQGRTCETLDLCNQLCEQECIIQECFRNNREILHNYYHPSGRSLKIRIFPSSSDDAQPESVIVFSQDITEVLKNRTEMARASQLASVGELAANVAHEINNPLHGIINYADIIKSKPEQVDFVRDLAGRISHEGERISLIVRNLLEYTRSKSSKPEPAALQMIIESANMLLGHKLKSKNIQVDLDFPDNLPLVKVRSNQIQQVFINLLGNAYDALMEKEFGEDQQRRVIISARAIDGMVEICCEDNGAGIPAVELERVFESFYTTKPVGQGTGLGLSISKSIIDEHGGEIHISSVEGEMTKVCFTMPILTVPRPS